MRVLASSIVVFVAATTSSCRERSERMRGCPSKGPITVETLRADRIEAANRFEAGDFQGAMQKHYEIITFASAPESAKNPEAQILKVESIQSPYGIHERQLSIMLRAAILRNTN